MEHRKYTCDRCQGVINGTPASLGGEWYFGIGHAPLVKVKPGDPGHLCRECVDQIIALHRAFWAAFWPSRLRE